ncbi:MAG TPA: hypothetical protein VGR78_07260, partial [Verrucomicrobiae bacterium]|nr:hypothetical protein [Verrucomicrobiae bacterium]
TIFIEFKDSSVHVLDGEEGLDLPLERDLDGRISSASCALLENGLRGFLQRHGSSALPPALCSIPARGVIVRRVTLPAAAKGPVHQLVKLQLEAQLPVSPDDLGCFLTRLRAPEQSAGSPALQEFVVAAVRKEILKDYSGLLPRLGFYPPGSTAEFAVAPLSRAALLDQSGRPCSILEIGQTKSELTLLDERGPTSLRVISWGAENLGDMDRLHALLQHGLGEKNYLAGVNAPLAQIAAELAKRLPPTVSCQVLPVPTTPGHTSANLGASVLLDRREQPWLLDQSPIEQKPKAPAPWPWAVAACLLLLLSISLRYAESAFNKSRVTRQLDHITKYKATLPKIDRELSFLKYIKTNQPPYLDTMAVVASAAPSGTRIDTLTLVRHGDLSMQGSMQGNPQGPAEFRSKLVDSGFFARVVLEEQTPVENGQKMNFRMTAQLKPDETRKPFIPPEPAKRSSTNQAPANRPMPDAHPMPPQITQR